MEHSGVSRTQIAQACGITETQLATLMEKSEFQDELAKLAGEQFDKFDTLNQGWDMLENSAMLKVSNYLDKIGDSDPEFALKTAAFANKAKRRGRHENNPITVQPNNQAVIYVNAQFANKLQQNFTVTKRQNLELQKKDNNFLPPKNVQSLLTVKSEKDVQEMEKLEETLGDIGAFAPAI